MLLSTLSAVFVASLNAETWKIDSAHASAQFAVKHMMVSTVRGSMGAVSGTIEYDPARPSASVIKAEIDATGISTQNADRDKHLKSADFFDVEKFPKLSFQSTSVSPGTPGHLKMTGNLTIHGVTKEVTFDVEGPSTPISGPGGSKRSGATATAKINRKDFDLKWNRAIEAGGVAVGEEVTLTLDVEFTMAGAGKK